MYQFHFKKLAQFVALSSSAWLLVACGDPNPINNGDVLNSTGKAGSLTQFTLNIPVNTQAAMVDVSGSPAVSIQIVNANNVVVSDCASPTVCVLHSPASGKYTVNMNATADFNINLTAAWGGSGGATVLPGVKSANVVGRANVVGLNSVYVAEGNTDLSLDIDGAAVTDVDVSILDKEGNFVTHCADASHCELNNLAKGVYFIRHSTTSGFTALALEGFISELDFEGVWVATYAETNATVIRSSLVKLLDSLNKANSVTAVEEFREQYPAFFTDCAEGDFACSEAYFLQMQTMLETILDTSGQDAATLRAALVALPDVSVYGPFNECDAVRQPRMGYWDVSYNAVTQQYSIDYGATGTGTARTDNGCTWQATYDDTTVFPNTTDRNVTSQYLTDLVRAEGGEYNLVIDGADQFRILTDISFIKGTSIVMRRLSH